MQHHKALIRELPTQLMQHQSALYRSIEDERPGPARGAGAFHGVLMAWHVLSEHWVHIALMPLAARLSNLFAGLLSVGLSLPRGPVNDRCGGWNPQHHLRSSA